MKSNWLFLKGALTGISVDSLLMLAAISLIIAITVIVLLKKDKYTWYRQAPSLVTTIGIFCTFVGITVGLLRFDPSDENSLNYLLSGLRLAFIPSALAIFIAISFKWIASAYYTSNHSSELINQLEKNTESMEKLVKAIEVVDWQVAYRNNLEQNVEHSTQLLHLLESTLSSLLQTLSDKKENVNNAGVSLEEVINSCKNTLTKVNNDLNITTERLNQKVKNIFDTVQQQDKNLSSLLEVYGKLNGFNESMANLGDFASEITTQLKQSVHNEVKEMEVLITRSLKKIVGNNLV